MRAVMLTGVLASGALAATAISGPPGFAAPTTAPLVTGEVTSPSGRAAPGRSVVVHAWPSVDALEMMEEGETFKRRVIARGRTDRNGRFSLPLDARADLDRLMGAGHLVDVDVEVTGDRGSVASHSLTLGDDSAATPETPARVDVAASTVVDGAHLQLTLPSRGVGSGESNGSADMRELPTLSTRVTSTGAERAEQGSALRSRTADAGTAAVTAAAAFPNGCPSTGTRLVKKLGDRWVNVGNVFSRGQGKHLKFTYSGSADSSLGVGVSATGTYGSFSSGGTVTRERTLGVGWPLYKKPKSRYLDTLFSYGKYCTTVRSPGPSFSWKVKAIRHEGGTRHREAVFPSASKCVRYYSAGSESSKTTSNAMTWSNGAKLGGAIGIDLSSRTGFRTDAYQYWKFVKPGRLCGERDKPAGTPRLIAMKPKNW